MKLFVFIFLAGSISGWRAQSYAENNENLKFGLYKSNHFDLINNRLKSEKGKNILVLDVTPSFKIFDTERFGDFSMNLEYGRVLNSNHIVSLGVGINFVDMVPNIGLGYEYQFLTQGSLSAGLNANMWITVPNFGLGIGAGPFLKMAVLPQIDILFKAGMNTIIPIHHFKLYLEEVSLYAGLQARWYFL